MAARTALLVAPLAVSSLEKTDSFSMAVDCSLEAKGDNLGRWYRRWFADAANVADRTRSLEQARGSIIVLYPLESPSIETSVGAMFSETDLDVNKRPELLFEVKSRTVIEKHPA